MYPHSQMSQQCNTYPQTNLELALMLMARLNSSELAIVKSLIGTFSNEVASPQTDIAITVQEITLARGEEVYRFIKNGDYRGFIVPININEECCYYLVTVNKREYVFESRTKYSLNDISIAVVNNFRLRTAGLECDSPFNQLSILDGILYTLPVNSYDETPGTNLPITGSDKILWVLDSDSKSKVYDVIMTLPERFITV